MEHASPIIWVIGATRSCKTALAQHGIAPLGFYMISTADFFRKQYGQPDTYSRQFVFNISAFAAETLSKDPDCNIRYLQDIAKQQHKPCVIEGERNPVEFAKLYDPKNDMVIILNRQDVDVYDTAIERGIESIEKIVRWNISTGIAPQDSAMKLTFGLEEIKADYFGVNNAPDTTFLSGKVKPKSSEGEIEDRYPWIGILIGLVREKISEHYHLMPISQPPQVQPTV